MARMFDSVVLTADLSSIADEIQAIISLIDNNKISVTSYEGDASDAVTSSINKAVDSLIGIKPDLEKLIACVNAQKEVYKSGEAAVAEQLGGSSAPSPSSERGSTSHNMNFTKE